MQLINTWEQYLVDTMKKPYHNKMVLWDEIVDMSLKNSITLPFRMELKYFFDPLMEIISNDLIEGKVKGYSANGLEPPIFTNRLSRVFIKQTGPSGVIFLAKDLDSYINKFEFKGTNYQEDIFCSAKRAFRDAIINVQDQSWNMKLAPVIFTCNQEDFAREVGGHFTLAQKMH